MRVGIFFFYYFLRLVGTDLIITMYSSRIAKVLTLAIRRYSPAIASMAMGSVESITVELFYILTHIPTVVIAIISTPIGGCVMLIVHRVIKKRKFTIHRSWKTLLIMCALFAAIQFTWFDAIKRIGAGRTSLIDIPLETVAAIGFAWIILSERLHKLQMLGAGLAVSGVIMVIASGSSSSLTQLGIGEIEAIVSALLSGLEVCVTARLLKNHEVTEVSGFLLLASGLILTTTLPFMDIDFNISTGSWLYLILIAPFIPLGLSLTNMLSLKSIGASITTIIWSFSSVLTVIVAFVLFQTGLPFAVPDNMALAVAGGVISVVGIVVIVGRNQE